MKSIIIFILGALLIVSAGFGEIGPDRFVKPGRMALYPVPPSGGTDDDTIIFHETFESGLGEWTTVDLTIQENEWHPDLFNAYEGNSWWCGDSNAAGAGYMGYDNFWLQFMDSPVLDLSGTISPILTFQVFWSVESPFNVPPAPPYDGWDGCNVWISTDGGTHFTPMVPAGPAYTCASLSSFGTVWGMGPNIPGWADQSLSWQPAEFNLQPYIGPNVVIRFAFCSDRAVASSTGHPELIGFFVDDVVVADGASIIMSNNADDPPVPGEFTFEQGPPFGDWWEMTETTSYSPTHCMVVDDDNFYINDALVSPPIPLPEDFTLWFKYAVLCDLPDSTHPSSTSLRDYYFVDITADGGVNWGQQFYDYARGYCYPNWGICAPDTPYVGNMTMDLSQWGGDTIQIRFRCVTDGDHISGNGSGLHIDDLWVIGNDMLADDVGAANLHIPFPNTVDYTIDGSVELHNYGLNDQNQVASFFVVDGDVTPLIPWQSILSGAYVDVNFNWTPASTGDFNPYVYTMLAGDMNPANDTTFCGGVEVIEQPYFLLGYDNREGVYYYQFDIGEGPMVKFSRPENLQMWLNVENVKAMFNGDLPGTVEFIYHVYDEGTPTTPGAEVFSDVVTVDPSQTYPNWWTADYGYNPTQCLYGDFWIWFEITDPQGFPHPVGHNRMWGEGHYFNYDGATPVEYSDDFMMRALMAEGFIGVEEQPGVSPFEFALSQNYPNPFNPKTAISYQLPAAGMVKLAVYDITGREAASLVDGYKSAGEYEVVFDGSELSSGIYFVRLSAGVFEDVRKMVLLK